MLLQTTGTMVGPIVIEFEGGRQAPINIWLKAEPGQLGFLLCVIGWYSDTALSLPIVFFYCVGKLKLTFHSHFILPWSYDFGCEFDPDS